MLTRPQDTLPLHYPIASTGTQGANATTQGAGSFWASSFLTGSDGHTYMVLSHVLTQPSLAYYRASLLDVTDPSAGYKQFCHVTTTAAALPADNAGKSYNSTFSDFSLASTSPTDPLTEFRTWSTVSGVEFDLTFSTTSSLLLNGGTGLFDVANGTQWEWSMPAGFTTGYVVNANGTRITVDWTNSLTWYDRQLSPSPGNFGGANWTWFELHLRNGNKPDVTMSIWFANSSTAGDLPVSFATVREAPGKNAVLGAHLDITSDRTFVSASTNVTYPLDWTVTLADGTSLHISSVLADQELHTDDGLVPSYEGFVTVNGSMTGYGLVEMVPVTGVSL
jgi:hypothetical protein